LEFTFRARSKTWPTSGIWTQRQKPARTGGSKIASGIGASLIIEQGQDKSFAINSSGRSGGLGLFWNNEIKIEVLPYSQYHLDAIVSEQG
jgi:hypothetical protein